MFFKHPRLISLLLLSLQYFFSSSTHRKGSPESKLGKLANAHNNTSMVRSTIISTASKNVCKKPLLRPALKDLLKDPAWKLNLLAMLNSP